jgi:hypothetical protein
LNVGGCGGSGDQDVGVEEIVGRLAHRFTASFHYLDEYPMA